jgi:plasmid stability protein
MVNGRVGWLRMRRRDIISIRPDIRRKSCRLSSFATCHPETHEALKARARAKGRSTEAEIREILKDAVAPAEALKLGTELSKLGRELGLEDFTLERDTTPPRFVDFE